MNWEHLITGEKGTHSDHREEDADGSEDRLRWSDTGDLLRQIRGVDGHVQRGDNTAPPLRSLGVGIHEPE